MQIVTDWASIKPRRRRAVITVGVFDGVHVGHRRILEETRMLARGLACRSVAVTFEPHPVAVLVPRRAPALLTGLRERLRLLRASGVDETLVLGFSPKLGARRAEWFVRRLLLGKLNLARLVIGYDFRFGKGREGDAGYLEALGGELGFGVDIVPPVMHRGRPVSSTRIREALARGDVASAGLMLGRPYGLTGKVIRGEGRGRTLGYPTANLAAEEPGKLLPADGVYAARVMMGGAVRPGVLYVGTRPTYGGGSRGVEVHLLDAAERLYGRSMAVEFVARLRGERAFGSDRALRLAVAVDVRRARRALRN